jgi:glycosyltransferase involved in cell wall biosynthesis
LVDLLQAVSIVRDVVPSLRLVLTGTAHSSSEAYARVLVSEIARLGLAATVRMERGFPANQMADVFCAADVVVQPSHAEGLGLAVLEAMAARRPVVATSVSGIDEIITSDDLGCLVPPHDPDALARGILTMIGDREQAEACATNGHRLVEEHFSVGAMVQKVEEVYEMEVTEAGRRSAIVADATRHG